MLGVGVSLRHMRGATSALAFYAANGLRPTFVLDPSRQKYFVDGLSTDLAGAVTHSRASGATYLDSSGTLQTAASGEIRDQAYAYVDGVLTGPYLLTEPDGVNLITYSEDFTDTAWTKNSLTANFVSSTNPAGENSVVELVESSTNAVHFAITSTPGVSTGYYTWSLFAKLGTGTRYIQLRTAGAGVYANFDLSAGAVVDSGGAYIVSADIVDFGKGWYRCVVIGNFGVAPSGAQIIMSNGAGAAPSYLGDGTSSILIYGADFKPGSTLSSYIPTSGSQGARAEDVLTIPNPPWPSGDPGSRAIGISMKGLRTGESSIFADWTLDANNGIQIASGASDFTFTQEAAGVLDSVTGGSYTSGINVPFSIASRHGDNFINGAVDGTALTVDLTPTILPDLSATPIAIRASGGPLYLEEMRIWVESAVDKITDTLIEEASAP